MQRACHHLADVDPHAFCLTSLPTMLHTGLRLPHTLHDLGRCTNAQTWWRSTLAQHRTCACDGQHSRTRRGENAHVTRAAVPRTQHAAYLARTERPAARHAAAWNVGHTSHTWTSPGWLGGRCGRGAHPANRTGAPALFPLHFVLPRLPTRAFKTPRALLEHPSFFQFFAGTNLLPCAVACAGSPCCASDF